jgi:hypothetical protein
VNEPPRWPSSTEFDVVGVSVAAALVSGALSVLAPSLIALTASLAVLAVAGWLILYRQTPGPVRRRWMRRSGGALAAVAGVSVLFLLGGDPLFDYRGLLLGASLVPLWGVARRFPIGVP